jgi:hypothetical protein
MDLPFHQLRASPVLGLVLGKAPCQEALQKQLKSQRGEKRNHQSWLRLNNASRRPKFSHSKKKGHASERDPNWSLAKRSVSKVHQIFAAR